MIPSPPSHEDDDSSDLPERPSKSQIKREMHALLDLGRELVELSPDRLKQLPLGERLHEAILLAQRTPSREGLRRQVHYVGKLMRDVQADLIRAQLDTWKNGSREETARMHHLEALRDELLVDDQALTALLSRHPGADVQHLRALIRAGRKESDANKQLRPGQEPQKKNYRALFQALKSLESQQENPSNG